MGSYHYDGHKWLRRIGSNSSIVIGGHDDVVNLLKKQQERIDALESFALHMKNRYPNSPYIVSMANEALDLKPPEPQSEE